VPPGEPRSAAIMAWFRVHARVVSGVALFALALQLALSFGHIHRKDILGPKPYSPAAAVLALAASDAGATTPSDPAGLDHDDDYCAICAINGLIGSAQHAEPPSLPLPLQVAAIALAADIRSLPTERHHRLAQARAPPLA